jgi:RNA polymerase sigma factor (sigma-70 family)
LAASVIHTDSEIIANLHGGVNDTMKVLYHDHFGMVSYMVTKHKGNDADSEDIFQETMFILYDLVQRKDFELTVTLRTLIYSIARNLWLNVLRNRGKASVNLKNHERHIQVDMSAHGNLIFAKDEAYVKVEKAFRILGEKCQKILTLYYFHHKSIEDIARILENPDDEVVKNQKYRCIQNIKRMI